jgi:hypothetical protein
MKSANPTRLRLGMTGTLRDRRYRIAGRVVMGMEEAGETYYWNEFHLVSADGAEATLVFEETERGPQWRLFVMFEPQCPITAEDAATRRVGDAVNLEGTEVRVTVVDESRVHYIEGQAPEGVELGDVARYFNAEAPGFMVVVSWTGAEVECYEGWDLTADTVRSAFNLPGDPVGGFASLQSQTPSAGVASFVAVGIVCLLLLGAALFVAKSFWVRSAPGPATLLKAPVVQPAISAGTSLNLQGKRYRVVEHALVEVATVSRRYDRHEFRLDDGEVQARLIFGFNPGKSDWFLFTRCEPNTPLTPEKAANVRAGQVISLGNRAGTVTELYQETVRNSESAEASDSSKPARSFGFRAQSASAEFLVEWNEAGVVCYSGTALSAKEMAGALGVPKAK